MRFHFHLLKHIYVQTYIEIQNMMQNQSSGVFFMLLKACDIKSRFENQRVLKLKPFTPKQPTI